MFSDCFCMPSMGKRVVVRVAALLVAAGALGSVAPSFAQTTSTLISVNSASQLHAIRWDLDGDGVPAEASSASWNAAFPSVACAPNCTGYALDADIDLGASRWSRSSSSEGWLPIGGENTGYDADFDGRGHVITGLYINRPGSDHVGLFGRISRGRNVATRLNRIQNLGFLDVDVTGRNRVGALTGWVSTSTVVTTIYVAGGSVTGEENVGGLVGLLGHTVIAVYASVAVSGTSNVGGLVGHSGGGAVKELTASYAAGRVTGTSNVGGLVGRQTGLAPTVTASYWDTLASGQGASALGIGTSTEALQMPTTYGGLYAAWNVDVDGSTMTGVGGNDDPWDFGTSMQYPVLQYGGFSVARQRGGAEPVELTGPPVVFASSTYSEVESTSGGVTVTVRLSDEALRVSDFSVTGTVTALDDGTTLALSGGAVHLHYDMSTSPVAFRLDQTATRADVTIPIIADEIPEDEETISLRLSSFGHPASAQTATVTITDDDEVTVGLENTSYALTEGTTLSICAVVTMPTAATPVEREFSVEVLSNAGSAGSGDFSAETGRLTFASGTRSACFGFEATDDDVAENEESMFLNLDRPSRALLGDDQAEVTITDDDPIILGFASTEVAVVEGASSSATVCVEISAPAMIERGPAFSLSLRTTDGSASAGSDYTPPSSPTIGPFGVGSNRRVCRNVALINDNAVESTETFTVNLGFASALEGVVINTDSNTLTVTIADDDDATLISVNSAAQLHAIRWDLDGDGVPAEASSASWRAAFPSVACAPNCTGYALDADIDLGASRWSRSSSSEGWRPIGGEHGYDAHFDGRGHVITGLYINRPSSDHVGLFGRISRGRSADTRLNRIQNLGLRDVDVTGRNRVGALTGWVSTSTVVSTIYVAGGSVTGNDDVGGLVGLLGHDVIAVYASVAVSGTNNVGGLAGHSGGGSNKELTASYAAGRVTGTTNVGGLVGRKTDELTTVNNSYWDTLASGQSASALGASTSTEALQMPTTYGGIYAAWNVDVDGSTMTGVDGNDDPWNFGTSVQYPALQYGGFSVARQRGAVPVELTGPPVVFEGATATSVSEGNAGGTTLHFTIGLAPEARQTAGFAASAMVVTVDGTAVAPGDYGTISHAVTLRAAGPVTARVSVVIKGDQIPEEHESFSLRLVSRGDLATVQTATVTIQDDEVIGLQWVSDTYEVSESSASRMACLEIQDVNRNAGLASTSNRMERVFVVEAYTQNTNPAEATAPADYTETTATLEFGDATRTSCITVPIVNDRVQENNEAFTVNFRDLPRAVEKGTVQQTQVIIQDDDVVSFGFERSSLRLREGEPVTACVVSDIGFTSPLFIAQLTVADGSAEHPGDYDRGASSARSITVQPDPVRGRTCTSVPTVDDAVAESDETFTISSTLQFAAASNTLTVTIEDNDAPTAIAVRTPAQLHALRWDLDGDGVPAAASSASWRAAFPSVACAPNCTGYALDADIDLGASRWSRSSSTEGWLPIGTESDNFVADFDGQGRVIENLFINRPTQDNVGLFGYFGFKTGQAHTVADTPFLRNVGIVDADVSGRNEVGALAGRVSTGTVVTSYVIGGTVSGTSEVGGLVGVLLDDHDEGIRVSYARVRVRGGSSVGGLVGRNHNDSAASIIASYAAGAVTGTSMVGGLVGRSASVSGGENAKDSYWDTEVSGLTVSAGTGAIGTDTASLQTPTTYSGIYANWNIDVDGSTMTGVDGNDDPWDFGTSMQYPALQASSFSVARQRGAVPVELTGPPVVFSSSMYSAVESSGGVVTVTVRLSDEARMIGDFSVTGTVTGLDDGTTIVMNFRGDTFFYYDLSTSPVVFSLNASDAMQADVAISIVDDVIPEEAKTIPLQLVSAGYSESTQMATATIEDDDPVVIGFQRTSYSIDEDAGGGSVCVQPTTPLSTQPLDRQFSLRVSTRPGTAGTNDYTSINQQDVGPFSNRTRRQCFSIDITDDAIREDAESFFLDLTAPPGQTLERVSINPAVAEVAIGEDDGITIGFEQTTLTVTEGVDSSASVCVAITDPSDASMIERMNFNLMLSMADGSAVAGEDYVSSATAIGPFGGSSPRLCRGVALISDDVAESPETFTINLGFVAGADAPERVTIDPNGNALTVTIVDSGGTLIAVNTPEQLHAMRWDLDGDGVPAAASSTSWNAAFPSVACAPNCTGYALDADIDLGASRWSRSSSSEGWRPIGTESDNFVADFDGRGRVIENLFINRPTQDNVGLFGYFGFKTGQAHTVADTPFLRNVGIVDADVSGRNEVGALAGRVSTGTVVTSYVIGGTVSGTSEVGGLVGVLIDTQSDGIRASYARVRVRGGSSAGGLLGRNNDKSAAKIIASYAAGAVTGTSMVGGLVGQSASVSGGGDNYIDSYWDTEASGLTANAGSGAIGTDTASLQTPTTYSGIYANWNIDVDGDAMTGVNGNDDPWDFGTSMQYPALQYGGFSVGRQRDMVAPPPEAGADTEPPQFLFGDDAPAFAPGSSRLWLPLSEEVKILSERENARNSTASVSLGAGTEFEGFVVILNLQSRVDPCADNSAAMTIGITRAYYDDARAVVLELARPFARAEDNVWVGYCYQSGRENPGIYDLALEQGTAAPDGGRNLLRSAIGRMTRDARSDRDGDGIADALETRLGSNPLSAEGVPDDVPTVTLARGVAATAHVAYSGMRASGVLEHLGVAVTPTAARLRAYYLSHTFGYSSGGETVAYGCDGRFPSNYDAPLLEGGCATVDFGNMRAGVDHVIGWLAANASGYRFTTATASGLPQQSVRRVVELNMASQRLYTRGAGGGVAVYAMQDGAAAAGAQLVTTQTGGTRMEQRVALLTTSGRILVEIAEEASRYGIIRADTGKDTPQLLWRPDGSSELTADKYSLGLVPTTRVSLLPQAKLLLGPAELTRNGEARTDLRVGESGYSLRIAARAPADGSAKVVDVRRASTPTGATGALGANWNTTSGYVETTVPFGIAADATTATLVLRVTLSSGDNSVESEYGWPILSATDDDGDGIENAADNFGGGTVLPVIVTGTMAGADSSHHMRPVLPLHRLRIGGSVRDRVRGYDMQGLSLSYSDYAASSENASYNNVVYDVVYDFEIHGVGVAEISTDGSVTGGVAGVIIPLPESLYPLPGLVPVKLPSGDTFDTSGANDYGFAPLDGGACPSDAGGRYDKAGDGRIEKERGHACLVIYVVDGGPNDEDGAVNGIVDDPLGLGAAPGDTVSSGGGFGLAGALALLVLASAALLQRRRTRRQKQNPSPKGSCIVVFVSTP